MSESNLGRVQGGGFFGSTSTSATSIPKTTVKKEGVSPLVGDSIINANGDVCEIKAITNTDYTVTKYGSFKGGKGDAGASCLSGASAPASSTGNVGDLYLDTSTGNVYNKKESGWGTPIFTVVQASALENYYTKDETVDLVMRRPIGKIYGVSGMGSVTPVWQRTYDAAGVTLSLTNQSGNSNLVNFVLSDNAMQEFFHFQETTDANGNVFLVIPPLAFRYDRINENEVEALSVKLYEDGDEQYGFELHPAFKKWTSNTVYSGYGNIQIAKYLSAPLDTVTRRAAEGDVSSCNVSEIKVRSVKGEDYTQSYASWSKGLQIIKATDASYRMLHWSYRDLIVKLATIFFARSDIYNMLDLEDGCELDPTTGTTDAIQSHSGFNRTSGQMKLFGIDAAFDATTINGVYQNSDRSVYYTHLLDTDAETASGYTKSDLTVPVSYSGDNYSGPITKISVDAHERALGFPSANIHLPVGEEASEKKNHSTYYSSKYYDWGAPSSRGQVWAFQKYLSGDGGTLFTDNGLFFVYWFDEFVRAWGFYSAAVAPCVFAKKPLEGVGKGASPYENKA